MPVRIDGRIAALALVALASSCRPGPVRPTDLRPLPSAKEALEQLRVEGATRTSMRALGRVTYFGEKGRVRLKAVMVAERPARFRIETLSPAEQPIDVMASDGTRLWLLSESKLREGPATPENIARVIPVQLRADELVDTLLGGFPTSERFQPDQLTWADEDQDRWRLTLNGEAGETVELRIRPDDKAVESVTIARPSRGRLVLEFSDLEAIDGARGSFPRKIVFRAEDRDLEVTIKLAEVEVNVAIPPTVFRIEAPPGIRPEPLDSPPVFLPSSTSTRAVGSSGGRQGAPHVD